MSNVIERATEIARADEMIGPEESIGCNLDEMGICNGADCIFDGYSPNQGTINFWVVSSDNPQTPTPLAAFLGRLEKTVAMQNGNGAHPSTTPPSPDGQ